MSCSDCLFLDHQTQSHVAIPCNSCQGDDSDKGYCVAARSLFGYVPIITKIVDISHAYDIIMRANENGTQLELLKWSQEKNAFLPADC